MLDEGIAFPEAGPRRRIYATAPENVAIVVSGGIAPGINAVIDQLRMKRISIKSVQPARISLEQSFMETLSDREERI